MMDRSPSPVQSGDDDEMVERLYSDCEELPEQDDVDEALELMPKRVNTFAVRPKKKSTPVRMMVTPASDDIHAEDQINAEEAEAPQVVREKLKIVIPARSTSKEREASATASKNTASFKSKRKSDVQENESASELEEQEPKLRGIC